MSKADLHIHTDVSDSSLDINETLDLALKNDVDLVAITNHDTTKGLKEAIEIGKIKNITVIPGIEISSYDYKRRRKVHILGYNFDLEGNAINKLCKRLLEDRNNLSIKQANIIKELGYNIDIENIKKYAKNSEVVYKQHIMMELIEKGYTDKIYSSLYNKLFKGDSPCNIEVDYIDAFEAVKAIINDGGIAVLAHPGQLNSYELAEELVEIGLKGIEKNHISHSEDDLKRIDELASRYDLILTGGSDFHGKYGKGNTIGSYITPIESLKYFTCK